MEPCLSKPEIVWNGTKNKRNIVAETVDEVHAKMRIDRMKAFHKSN
jgi:hypothetical protein